MPLRTGQQDEYMHTLRGGDTTAPPLVLMSGYGAGSAFWFRCVLALPVALFSMQLMLARQRLAMKPQKERDGSAANP